MHIYLPDILPWLLNIHCPLFWHNIVEIEHLSLRVRYRRPPWFRMYRGSGGVGVLAVVGGRGEKFIFFSSPPKLSPTHPRVITRSRRSYWKIGVYEQSINQGKQKNEAMTTRYNSSFVFIVWNSPFITDTIKRHRRWELWNWSRTNSGYLPGS